MLKIQYLNQLNIIRNTTPTERDVIMTLSKLAKQLDKNALRFAALGDMKRAFAAMGLAAHIRRQPKEYQLLKVSII